MPCCLTKYLSNCALLRWEHPVKHGIARHTSDSKRFYKRKPGIAPTSESNGRFSGRIVFICARNDSTSNNQQPRRNCAHDILQYAMCLDQQLRPWQLHVLSSLALSTLQGQSWYVEISFPTNFS